MAEEQCGAVVAAVLVLCLMVAAFQCEVAEATTYIVGGRNGWSFSVPGWPRGKKFKGGDILLFNYKKGAHNVALVDQAGYDGCIISPENVTVYTSGNDRITLAKGLTNFICGVPGDFDAGMKIQVTAF